MLLVKSGKITKNLPGIYHLSPSCSLMGPPRYNKSDSAEKTQESEDSYDQMGTAYSNWVLARSAKFNHEVSFLKRKYGKDRYNIHKLTNMDYMCSMVGRQDKYFLNLNEKIVLLAQMNHVCNVLKKDKGVYNQFGKLMDKIIQGMANPEDYICVGTLMNVMVDLGELYEPFWVAIMDALFVRKYDQEFDQLFGVYTGLYKYKKNIEEFNDYFEIQRNKIIFNIPIVFRNSLETMRQYIKFNTYNLKQCRILLKSVHQCKINQKYFWKSVNDWFSIFIREQLQSKQFQQFFIVPQNSIQKVLFDDGMIRPRSILQQVSQIAFILSQHGFISSRFFGFVENLIIYSIQYGSEIYIKYLDIEKEERIKRTNDASINKHMRIFKEQQKIELQMMQANYKTIFMNPTEVGSQSVIHCLIVIKRYYCKKPQESDGQRGRSSIDNRVISWLIMKLCQPKMKYKINQLLMIIECRDILSALKVDVRSLVIEKIKDVRYKDCSLNDLKDILLFLPLLQFQSTSYILEHFLSKAHPKDILELTRLFQRQSLTLQDFQQQAFINKQLEINPAQTQQQQNPREQIDRSHLLGKQKDQRWMPYLTNYFLRLPASVNYHENYFSFEENCYFLYLLLKNQQYWQNKIDYLYLGQMEKLKHSIKIASYSRGFKLQMGTYFYKLMNYIDLVAFFDGG